MRQIYRIAIILACALCAVCALSAQRERTVTVSATGSYVASQNETPAFGRAQALLVAKKQALREAGITEDVSTTVIIVTGGLDNDFQEISSELSRIELEGRVRVKEQNDAQPVFTSDHLVKYTTTIRAEVVIEETEEDLNFRIKTDGLKSAYLSGETMTFTVTPSTDCYLRVFLLGNHPNSNVQIYPLEGVFKDVRLKAEETVSFPPVLRKYLYDRPFDYTLEKENNDGSVEQDVLLIVALKKPYPFVEEVSYESVIRWLAKIKRNEKCVLWQGVNIVEN